MLDTLGYTEFMKILVTGGAGFIGSHITNFFLSMNYSVTVLDNFSTGNKENLDIRPNLELVEGSITNYQLVDTIMSRVDICFHLAAAVGVKNIVDNPIISFETNVIGSEIVLKSASRYGVRTILTSSSEIYGKNPKQPLTENSDRVLGSPQVDRWNRAYNWNFQNRKRKTWWLEIDFNIIKGF